MPRSPLLRPSLVALVSAEMISRLGSQMTFLALPWFVLATTGSPTKMGIVLAVEMAPIAVLGIPSGAVVARLGARRTMIIGDAARVPLMVSIPLLHEAGVLSFGLLLVLVALMGVFIAPYFAAQRIMLPEIVGEDEHVVAQANAVIEGGNNVTSLLGPAVAGVLIATAGVTNVLYLDAATFLVSFLLLWIFVPRRPPIPQTEESTGILAGLRFVLGDSLFGPMLAAAVFLNMFGSMMTASLPVLAFEEFDESARVAGAFFAAFGLGGILGTVLAIRLVGRHDPLKLAAFGIVAFSLPLWALVFPLPVAGVLVVLAATALFGPLVNAPLLGILTTRTPEALRAKVMTAVITVATLAGPIGLLVAGPLLEAVGPYGTFLVIAAGQTLAGLVFATIMLRNAGPDAAYAPRTASRMNGETRRPGIGPRGLP